MVGVGRGHCPFAKENFEFSKLKMHNFKPFYKTTLYENSPESYVNMVNIHKFQLSSFQL